MMEGGDKVEDYEPVIRLKVELSGGLEILFGGQRVFELTFPAKNDNRESPNMKTLIDHMNKSIVKQKQKDLFTLDGSIRPGVLVLVNDADWELEGKEQYRLNDRDNILFVSTLHGG